MNNGFRRATKLAALVASFLILLACSIGGLIPARKARSERPVLEMLTGDSVDEQGRLANPRYAFDPADPQIAVVVQIDPASQVQNDSLTLTWYQITFGGEQQLFTDTLQVQPGDRAFSIGKNPGSLAPGNYMVTASLADQTQDVYFSVSQSASPQPGPAPAASSQAGSGQTPIQGGSGTVPQSQFTQIPSSELTTGAVGASGNGCTLLIQEHDLRDIVYSSDLVPVDVALLTCDEADVQVSAGVGGPSQAVGKYHLPAQAAGEPGIIWNAASIDPCSLPGGSDTPDTHVLVSAQVLSGKAAGLSTQFDLRLGPDRMPPVLHVVSKPARGSKVGPGGKITLTIDAREPQPGGPWQTGMKDIQVYANPGGQVDDRPFQTAPRACRAKVKVVQPYTVTYTVPKNAPPQFDLCVSALDMQNPETTMCGTFFTGDHWIGTIQTTTSGDYGEAGICSGEKWKSAVDLSVADDGTVAGMGIAHNVAGATCAGIGVKDLKTDATTGNINVTGTFDGKSFKLHFQETSFDGSTPGLFNYSLLLGGELQVPVTGKGSAGGLLTVSQPAPGGVATANAEHLVDLTCQSCN